MLHILIIEDHQVVAEGISAMLNQMDYIESVWHVADGNSALEFLNQNNQIDIILLDINLPDCNGIELCLIIKQKYAEIGIIVLSTFNQAGIINKMLENGADAYLLKNTGLEELITAIEKVAVGKKFLSSEVQAILNKKNLLRTSKTPVFTKREKEVLALIAEGNTNSEIAEKLFISQLTVISHRKSLLDKTDSKNTAQLIKYCFEFGLL